MLKLIKLPLPLQLLVLELLYLKVILTLRFCELTAQGFHLRMLRGRGRGCGTLL